MSRTIIDYQIWDESMQRPTGENVFRQELNAGEQVIVPNIGDYIDLNPTDFIDSDGNKRNVVFGVVRSRLIQHFTKDFGFKHNDIDNCYVNIVIELIDDDLGKVSSKLIKQ